MVLLILIFYFVDHSAAYGKFNFIDIRELKPVDVLDKISLEEVPSLVIFYCFLTMSSSF